MLNSASDYEFVDVSNIGSFIHGKPLPVRYTSSSTSGAATCAYEDYLYLLEAYYERMNLEQDGQNNIQPAVRTVVAGAAEATTWTRPIGSIGGYGSIQFINKDSTIPMSLTQLGSPDSRSADAIGNQSFTLYAPKYSQYMIRSKSARKLEGWCRRFYDYHLLTRAAKNMQSNGTGGMFTNFTGVITTRTYRSDGSSSDRTQTLNFNSTYSGWSYYYTSSSNSEAIYTPSITKMPALKMPHAKSATMIVRGLLRVDGTSIAAYSYPVEMDVSNGNISMSDINWVQEITKTILSKHGYEYITDFKGKDALPQTNSTIVVEVGDGNLIVDFDFPADYNSWNWQPS